MAYIAGVDIGNSSTEVALLRTSDDGTHEFVASALYRTTGLKGTKKNVPGVVNALTRAAEQVGIDPGDIDRVLLNEAAPVIGDVAMETITETVITESTMIGHDPSTPGGVGLGTGTSVEITADMADHDPADPVIFLVPDSVDFADAAARINEWHENGYDVKGAIVQRDDAVLIHNRIDVEIPILDEVSDLDKIPRGQPTAVEVAPQATGKTIDELSNPYGIATVFALSAEETQKIIPVARALVGNKSAVVIKTPRGDVEERTIPAGNLHIVSGRGSTTEVPVDQGAEVIMEAVMNNWPVSDVRGESGSNIGGMLNRARDSMAEVTGQPMDSIEIRDIMAVDTLIPQAVQGSVAGEHSMESAVALAAMVKTQQLPMRQIADGIEAEIGTTVVIQGVEANMAVLGSLTTPGTDVPIAILDMGGGSTDAAYMDVDKEIDSIHLSGAGDMVTMLIDSELGLDDRDVAEAVKKYPSAKVQTLFSIREEDGTVDFLDEPVDPSLFGRTVLLEDDGEMRPVPVRKSPEEIRRVRRRAKRNVFVTNAERALNLITPTESIRQIPFVVMVGRSSLDFEIPEMISDALAEYGIVCGRANVRGEMGPRNAVATGLVLSHIGGGQYLDFELPAELSTSLERTPTKTE
ncbi:diol dehydratase reactivase subunit alpha [Halogranum rubrum]|uniref:Glycerol dehydratase reactivation factor, large subunit n=1 Tax=Halogranum salarium B-1 TaxID=1210908 RepID=J3EVS0_9EURY|nr:diol dehydratase reactivase subunit alpha [Halogranum salarium]EJN58777.1 glycerol dehydratase reactivation factor, large subunit [Halogranum salarium B-1]